MATTPNMVRWPIKLAILRLETMGVAGVSFKIHLEFTIHDYYKEIRTFNQQSLSLSIEILLDFKALKNKKSKETLPNALEAQKQR
jgi:hypothetical protein